MLPWDLRQGRGQCLLPREPEPGLSPWSLPDQTLPTSPLPRTEPADCWPWRGPSRKEAWSARSRFLPGPGAPATWGLRLPQTLDLRARVREEADGRKASARRSVLLSWQERMTGAGDKRRTCGWPCAPLSGSALAGPGASAETLLSACLPAHCRATPQARHCAGQGSRGEGQRWGGGHLAWVRGCNLSKALALFTLLLESGS